MALTFRGGIHTEEIRPSWDRPFEEIPAPDFITVSLPHGAKPLVEVGQRVRKGEKIAAHEQATVAPVFSGVSGEVVAIGEGEGEGIRIQNDFKEENHPDVLPFHTPIHKAEPEEIVRHLHEKGIRSPYENGESVAAQIRALGAGKRRLIVDGTETEPYLTASYRLLMEKAEEIVGGAKILMRACMAENCVFALEDTKEDAADSLLSLIRQSSAFAVAQVSNKYPQGNPRILVETLLKKPLTLGEEPESVGALIVRPETCWAVYRAFVLGLPDAWRPITVSGDCIKTPSNLICPVGTAYRILLDHCGGFTKMPDKLVAGGPLSGKALWNSAFSFDGNQTALLALSAEEEAPLPCIRCGRCAAACPAYLLPAKLSEFAADGDAVALSRYHISYCLECGCCSFVCPSKIPLLSYLKMGKKIV